MKEARSLRSRRSGEAPRRSLRPRRRRGSDGDRTKARFDAWGISWLGKALTRYAVTHRAVEDAKLPDRRPAAPVLLLFRVGQLLCENKLLSCVNSGRGNGRN